jgi:hypothetical protein
MRENTSRQTEEDEDSVDKDSDAATIADRAPERSIGLLSRATDRRFAAQNSVRSDAMKARGAPGAI